MKNILKVALVAVIGLFVLTGCRTSAVYNVDKMPFTNAKQISDEKVYQAIRTAGLNLGWQISKIKPGLAVGKLYLRDHLAEVTIPYTTSDFSILYKNSSNLSYDSAKNTIHANYNGWVQNLSNAIALQLNQVAE